MVRTAESKLVAWNDVEQFSAKLRAERKRLVTTNGCFDLIHWGHIHYLQEARALGDVLWCGLNSDVSVATLKGPKRPLVPASVRALQLAGLESVDFVTIFEETTPERWLSLVRPAIHAKGGDYAPQHLPEGRIVEANGGKVVCLSLSKGFSTTSLIERIQNMLYK